MTLPRARPVFRFEAYGHPNITATHPTTLEVTTESRLTSRGDCIVGVRATCGVSGLPLRLKQVLSTDLERAVFRIHAGVASFEVVGSGSSSLSFQHSEEMVVRKSDYASDRTLLVNADKAAVDMPRWMVRLLQNPEQLLKIEILVI
jgi:uncharacterized protein